MAICANKLMKLQRISEIRSNHHGNSKTELFVLRVTEYLKDSFQVLLSPGERSLARGFVFVCRQNIGVPFIDLKSVVETESQECSKSVSQNISEPPPPFTSLVPTFTTELSSPPMAAYDIGNVKREPLEDFHTDTTYLDHLMPYSNDVFDAPVDWLSNFVDDRSALHSISEQFGGQPTDYSHLNLNGVDRDQTLNRLNGASLNHRGAPYIEEFSTPFPAACSTSPPSPDFDHRLEAGAHDLDYEMKSFYAGQQLYATSQGGESAAVFGEDVDKLGLQKNGLALAVPGVCEEDEMACSSGDSDQDRDDSESGEREENAERLPEKCEYLVLKSCYDSGAHSPTSETPGTPPSCLILSQGDDGSNSSTGDMTSPIEQEKHRQSFFLSEEEKRTLITEGLPIPAGYPLTKSEERALKKVRRKIKNKISAQESRRKKKEYMETLEKRVELCSSENLDFRRKLDSMENTNRTLINQLQKLQAILATRVSRPTCAISTQTMDETSI